MKLDIQEERSFEVVIGLGDIEEELAARLVSTGRLKSTDVLRFDWDSSRREVTVRWAQRVLTGNGPKRPPLPEPAHEERGWTPK